MYVDASGAPNMVWNTAIDQSGTTYYWNSETGAAQYQQPPGFDAEAATHAGAYQPSPNRAGLKAQPVSRDRSSSGMRGLAGAFAKRRSSADNIFGAGKRAFPQSVQAAPRSIGSATKTAPVGSESPASKIRKKSSIQAGTASIALANRAVEWIASHASRSPRRWAPRDIALALSIGLLGLSTAMLLLSCCLMGARRLARAWVALRRAEQQAPYLHQASVAKS